MSVKILHAADLHLDSAFEGLPARKAALRRAEQRELLQRLTELARQEQVDLVLLSGDLLDSDNHYAETGEELLRCLRRLQIPVFIAPGNHDFYSDRSPYARLKLPENVHVFTRPQIEGVLLPELRVRVFGAAFTEKNSRPLLTGFHAPVTPGILNLLCLHGEVGARDSVYDPIAESELAESNLHYAALGHIHKASGLKQAGNIWYAWPGCPEGRGFDETGEKSVYLVELDEQSCRLEPRSIAKRRYEVLRVNVTGTDPLLAVHTQITDESVRDVYRVILTGEVAAPPDLDRLKRNLEEFFFELQLRDETHLQRDVWEKAGEDSLRGLFLLKLRRRYEEARSEEQRRQIEQAARWGLAAIDKREEVVCHDDP